MRSFFVTWAAAALLAWSPSVSAEDLPQELMDAVFGHMATAYVCRDALGGLANYDAAQTIATDSLPLLGIGRDESVLMVDQMSQKFEADPRVLPDDGEHMQACLEFMNEGLRQIEVVEAKIRTSD